MTLDLIIKWLVPFLCGAVVAGVGTVIALIKKLHSKDSVMQLGMQCLLRAEIIRTCEKYIDKGHCPLHIKEALSREYKAYHGLGGNDVATALFEQCMDLPPEPKKEEI